MLVYYLLYVCPVRRLTALDLGLSRARRSFTKPRACSMDGRAGQAVAEYGSCSHAQTVMHEGAAQTQTHASRLDGFLLRAIILRRYK